MSIGIYDNDMSTYTIVPFNLEAMKLSSYYKNKNEIVVLAPTFTPERHQKFFMRKDYDDGNYPRAMNKHSNVDYGGYAFTNGIYVPLPIEIEKSKPDTTLYAKMETAFLNSGVHDRKKIFDNLMNGEHGRLSLDGKTPWEDFMIQFKALPKARDLILHDYDLGAIEGGFEAVKWLLARARTDGWATKIGMKFPVQISKGEDLLKWAGLNPNSTFFSLRYNGIVDTSYWVEYINKVRQRAIYYNLEYWITNGNMTEEELCSEGLRKVLRQVIFSRTKRVNFSLKFMDHFFSDARWERVISLFQFYLTSLTSQKASTFFKALPSDTVFDFAKHIQEKPYRTFGPESINRQEAREIFEFVRENNYPLFCDFYELNFNTLKEENNDWI